MIEEVGNFSQSQNEFKEQTAPNLIDQLSGPYYDWSKAITAGDITRDGILILVRNYPCK